MTFSYKKKKPETIGTTNHWTNLTNQPTNRLTNNDTEEARLPHPFFLFFYVRFTLLVFFVLVPYLVHPCLLLIKSSCQVKSRQVKSRMFLFCSCSFSFSLSFFLSLCFSSLFFSFFSTHPRQRKRVYSNSLAGSLTCLTPNCLRRGPLAGRGCEILQQVLPLPLSPSESVH